MLLLIALAAAADAAPLVVDISGMPPQLKLIRAEVAKNGWAITCEGRSGEEGVLRLSAPAGVPSQKLRDFLDDRSRVGSGEWVDGFGGEPLPESCDHAPPVAHGDNIKQRVLEAGLPSEVESSLPIARDCGYSEAVIRPWREGDIGGVTKPKSEEWVSLDAGADASDRLGPLVCFMQMRMHVLRPEPGPLPWAPPRN